MSLKYRNKETGQVGEVKNLDPEVLVFIQYQSEIKVFDKAEFERTHQPVTPPCPTKGLGYWVCRGKEGQIKAHVLKRGADSKRRILQVLQEHERQVVIGSSRSLSFSEIALRTGIEKKFVIRTCIEMDEQDQLRVVGLDKCFVIGME